MSKVWYGSLQNRLEEGRNFTGREIKAGDDITMYLYSDRACYYVDFVEDQKHIKVRRYYHCADHEKEGGIGHQNWMLFKTWDEWNAYLSRFFPEHHNAGEHHEEPEPETWVFRYNKWMREVRYTNPVFCGTVREHKSLEKNGYFKHYYDLAGSISFGVRNYHYDWEF